MADVFISYKREDKALAEFAVKAVSAAGYSHWIDDRLTPVAHWDQLIEREIAAARAVLVLWTPAAKDSEWVRNEAHYAKDHKKLVQAKAAACELPLAFRMLQWADLTAWRGDQQHAGWLKALAWLEPLVGRAPRQAAPQQPSFHSFVLPPDTNQTADVGVFRPYNPLLAFDRNDPRTWGKVSRNAPCPCGSGKKYKYCHMACHCESGKPYRECHGANAGSAPQTNPLTIDLHAPRLELGDSSSLPTASRNSPCPCGSGRKYKYCHMPCSCGSGKPARECGPTHPVTA